jgi:hypothetical protein
MSEERRPWFCECGRCGERWKVCTLPADSFTVSRVLKNATCPNCHSQWQIYMCENYGDEAVTEPRSGDIAKALDQASNSTEQGK